MPSETKLPDDLASHPLADVITYFASSEQRNAYEVAQEMTELAALYRNVMRCDLLPADPENQSRTSSRIEALRTMRHSLPNDDSFEEEEPASRGSLTAAA